MKAPWEIEKENRNQKEEANQAPGIRDDKGKRVL